MAETTVNSANVVTRHESEVVKEYIRNNRFSKYIGTSENSIIRIREGKQIVSIPLIPRLKNAAVTGSSLLLGSEEALANYAWTLTPTYKRHGVRIDKEEADKPNFDLYAEAKPRLTARAKEEVRDDVVKALAAIYNGTTYSVYADASESAKDAWLVNNSDRVLFGAATSNYSGDHSVDLAKVDGTTDVLNTAAISLMKRIAKNADPHITPFRTMDDDQEWYVCFVNSYLFRDLKASLATSHQNAAPRDMKGNPIWTDGDLQYDGVIIREVPEMGVLSNVGASGTTDVGIAAFCGAEAVGFGLGQRPKLIEDRDYDFKFRPGCAVEYKHDIKKMFFNNIQHGMVTGYFASVAD